MTKLSAISGHVLYITCRRCGHDAGIVLRQLAERTPDITVRELADGARCSMCGAKGHTDIRIVWSGSAPTA